MHEIILAEKVLKEAKKAGATNFLRVEVGELSEITCDELELALKKLTNPSYEEKEYLEINNSIKLDNIKRNNIGKDLLIANKWDIKVDFVQSEVKCKCGYIGKARIVDRGHGYCIYNCPKCSGNPQVLKGGEIKIIQIG